MRYQEESKEICITWSIDDVLQQASDRDIEITKDQASDILHAMKDNHNAEIGISWSTIDYYLDQIQRDA